VRVIFSRYHFRIQGQDDGVGNPPKILAEGKEGHFGLRGLKERAQRIKTKLQIESLSTGGTTVRLTVPARVVYSPKERAWWQRLFAR
jgi:signal transduction histidine kinase